MIKVSNVEYVVPNAANRVGSLSITLEMIIPFEEGKTVSVSDMEKDVEFSDATTAKLAELRDLIVSDIAK